MTTTTTMTTMEEEEEENDDAEIQHVFVAHEIDLDYEFDAARFFDFTRPESSFESHQAQLWFQTAPNYPPSPFVTKLAVREEFELDVDRSTKLKNVECAMSNVDDDKEEAGPTTVSSAMEISDIVDGRTYGSKPIGNSLNSNFKPDVPKGSTLMKPTATQLSRQNRPAKNVGSRFRKQLTQKEMNLSTSSGVESQAAKRQKLEGGHLCKVTDTKQQTNFVHKKPMRAVTVEQNSACSKLKLTIPREPDLKTAHRAQRIRPKIVGEAEHMTVAAPRFKARPLNRRILEAPSLPLPKRSTPHLPEFREFHLKTTERAMQHTSALLLIKALHWLAQKRVEYIETTPTVTTLSHIRIVSFMGFLLLLDSIFLYSSLKHLIETWQASVSLFFAFEYMILATTTVSIFVKYVFYVSDMLMEGQWEKKPVFTFYLELVRDLLHLSMYLCFFCVIFVNYGIPLHLIRELYETFRNFKVRIADYIRYRKITSNMNDRFPDATPEELIASDATCIICREEMTTAKKLICGHLFHVHCLRSWLERQHTCPTCRALVVPPENGTTVAGGQQGSQSDGQRQGTGTGSTSQTEVGSGVATDSLSRHQARLQAAAAAASIYEKSYVYPSATSFVRPPGEASSQQAQKQFHIPGGPANVPFPPMGHFHLIPSQAHGTHLNYGEGFGNDPNIQSLQLELNKKLLQQQIEILQNHLQNLQFTEAERSVDDGTSSSESRGKLSTSADIQD